MILQSSLRGGIAKRGLSVALVVVLLGVASVASASPIVPGDHVRFGDGPGTTGGGEFNLTVNGLDQFVTFCLQRTEYMDYSSTFTVGSINPYTLTDPSGNGGDAQGRDWLDPRTAWLYTQFRNGGLASYGYDYTAGTQAHVAAANALQNAIWWFENELSSNPNNDFIAAANNAINTGAWSGIGDVRALNLYYNNGLEAQDQLALIPTPEPASLTLIGSGVLLMLEKRRRAKKQRAAVATASV
jgi:hypothetical protein